jgi:hypothetical protein
MVLFSSFLDRLAQRRPHPRRRGRARGSAYARFRLEPFENRLLLSIVSWVGGDGDWETPSNWSTGILPGPQDDVIIAVSGTLTITHSGGTDCIHSLYSLETIDLTGGVLDVAAASLINSTLNLSARGTLQGAGDLTVHAFNWTGGKMAGVAGQVGGQTLIATGGFLTISGTDEKDLWRTVNNFGETDWLGGDAPAVISVGPNVTFNNEHGATFNVQDNTLWQLPLGDGAVFNNVGTFVRRGAGGDSTTTTFAQTAFNNNGVVNVQVGTLDLTGDASVRSTSGGTFAVANDATLLLGNQNLTSDSTVNAGNGTVNFTGFQNTVAGDFTSRQTTIGGASPIVDFNNAAMIIGTLNLQQGTLEGSGTVTVMGAMTWTGGRMLGPGTTSLDATKVLTVSGSTTLDGRVLAGLGKVEVSAGTLTWRGGTLGTGGGTDVDSGAHLDIRGSAAHVIATAPLNNLGIVSWSDDGAIWFQSEGGIRNESGSVPPAYFQDDSDGGGAASVVDKGGGGSFINEAGATYEKEQGVTTFGAGVSFSNQGSVQVVASPMEPTVLTLAEGDSSSGSSASFSLSGAQAHLNFSGVRFNLDSRVSGSGKVTYQAGTTSVTGSYASSLHTVVTGTGTAVFSTPNLTFANTLELSQSGTLDLQADATVGAAGFLWTDGGTLQGSGTTLSLAVGSSPQISGTVTLNHCHLVNHGNVSWYPAAGSLQSSILLTQAATIANDGTFDAQGKTSLVSTDNQLAFTNMNLGTLQTSHGAVTLLNLQVDNQGTINAGNQTTLQLANNDMFESGSQVTGTGLVMVSGGVDLVFPSSVLSNLALSAPGELLFLGNTAMMNRLTWTGGSLVGNSPTTLTVTGSLDISGTDNKSLNDLMLNNAGAGTWTGTGPILFENGANFANAAGAAFSASANSRMEVIDGGASQFTNQGTFTKTDGTTSQLVLRFVNDSGSVRVQGGTLALDDVHNAGLVTVGAGTNLTVSVGYTQSAGETTLDGGTLAVNGGSGLVDIQAGTLDGQGTISGNVRNAGQLNVGTSGTPGVLTINGDYTQAGSGSLQVEIGGTASGSAYDVLAVTGEASLAGTLTVALINGFTPDPTDQFQILTYRTLSGTFDAIDPPPGWTIDPQYGDQGLSIELSPAASGHRPRSNPMTSPR